MRKLGVAAGLVAVLGAVIFLAEGPAGSSPGRTFTFIEKDTQMAQVDLGDKGPSLGDLVLVFAADLKNRATSRNTGERNSGCDVESWTQSDSGHALVAHASTPTFTSEVAT